MGFKRIDPKELQLSPAKLFLKDWALLTAGGVEKHNCMTIGWGGLGVLWGMPAATVYVRPERLTWSYMNESDGFTVCAFDESWREKLVLCGTKSGRDVDKDALCGLTPAAAENGAAYYEEARLVLVCRKIYSQDLDAERILDERGAKVYTEGAQLHRMYVGEIVEVLIKED